MKPDVGLGLGVAGGGRQVIEVENPTVGRLRCAHRHQVGVGPDLVEQMIEGHRSHVQSIVDQEREQNRGEVLLGAQHVGSVGQAGRHQAGWGRHLADERHVANVSARQAGERSARAVDVVIEAHRVATAGLPRILGPSHRGHRCARGNPTDPVFR